MQILLQLIFILLFFIAFIGSLQSLLKGPAVVQTPNDGVSRGLDNNYRFMAGVYLGVSIVCGWMAYTIQEQGTLVYLVALMVFLAGTGRVLSMTLKGAANQKYYLYVIAEWGIPVVIVTLQYMRNP